MEAETELNDLSMRHVETPSRHLLTLAAWFALATAASAQGPWHYLNKADMPPGVIGQRQLQRGGPMPGYFQPVEVTAPAGTTLEEAVSLAGVVLRPLDRLGVADRGDGSVASGDTIRVIRVSDAQTVVEEPIAFGVNIEFFTREVTVGAPSTQWWINLSTAIVFGLVSTQEQSRLRSRSPA